MNTRPLNSLHRGWICFASLLLLPCPLPAQTTPVRVAIISEQPAALPAADLLTVKLSGKSGLQLLERAEIDKVYREQSLSAANRDYVKLGLVLGANGLVLLSPLTDGTNQFLQARLVATGPGVIISSLRFPWPLKDTAEWADWVTRRFEPLLPKLTVLARDAIPISIVNLRAAARSREGEELERQLTPLAVERLSREREFFVLERQRMELLTAEKDLRGAGETAFWNGSHLLDGVLDRDGYSKDAVTLSARLMPAQGGQPVLIEVSGSRTNLSEVLDRLVQKVREGLKLGSTGTPWDAAEEAAAYFREAQWAMRWGMFSEAQSACESSWALGLQTKEVAELRIRAYKALGGPELSAVLWMPVTSLANMPDVARLKPSIHALELYQEGFETFIRDEPRPDTNWFRLGLRLLNSGLLRQFNCFPELCQGHEPDLAELRSLSRQTLLMLQSHPLYANLSVPLEGFENGSYWDIRLGLFFSEPNNLSPLTILNLGAYWHEGPEASLAAYKALADAGHLHDNRQLFVDHVITAWSDTDKARLPAVWHSFIGELCASTNPLHRVEGYYLHFRETSPLQFSRAQKLFEVTLESARPLKQGGVTEGLVNDIRSPIWGFAVPGNANEQNIRHAFETFQTEFAVASDAASRSIRLEVMTNFLTGSAPADPGLLYQKFNPLFSASEIARGPLYLKSEAEVLLPLMQEFERSTRARAQTNGVLASYVLPSITNVLSTLRIAANVPGEGHPATNNTPQAARPPAPAAKPTLTTMVPRQIPSLGQASGLLKTTSFWPWPSDLPGEFDDFPTAGPAVFREGRVWIRVDYTSQEYRLQKIILFGINPATLSAQSIELPILKNKFSISRTESVDDYAALDSFEVFRGKYFASIGGQVKRYSPATKTWEDLPVPVAGRLSVLDDRLFVTTDDSIAEISADGNSQTILASARRQPPLTVLDSLEHYKQPAIFHASGGYIATRIGNEVYAWDGASKSWSAIPDLPGQPQSSANELPIGPRALAYEVSGFGTNILFAPLDQTSYAMRRPQPAGIFATNSSLRECKWEEPLWQSDEHGRYRIFLSSSNAWLTFSQHVLEKGADGSPVIHAPTAVPGAKGGRAFVQVFWPDLGSPLTLPLELKLNPAGLPAEWLLKLNYGTPSPEKINVQPVATPAGILLVDYRIGLWLIPWSELGDALQKARAERLTRMQARQRVMDDLWEKLFQKYQLTSRDNFTPDQKEAMIDDPAFLELNVDKIDSNHNGKLDPDEWIFFDANHNGTLEPRELAGMNAALDLMTHALMDEYDLNQDGLLDKQELASMARDTTNPHEQQGQSPGLRLPSSNINSDGALSPVELRRLLVSDSTAHSRPPFSGAPPSMPLTAIMVENYWKYGLGRIPFPMRAIPLRRGGPGSTNALVRPAAPRSAASPTEPAKQ